MQADDREQDEREHAALVVAPASGRPAPSDDANPSAAMASTGQEAYQLSQTIVSPNRAVVVAG